MTITDSMTERLRAAAEYIKINGWTQGTERDRAGRVCLTGAIRYCAPVDGDVFLIREVLRRRGRGESWNDAAGRTSSEVEEYLRTADITDADLAGTFGPQWEQVVALVRRAAALNADEAAQLHATWYVTQGASWAASWNAARSAAVRSAGRSAARSAAGEAARYASRYATRYAAGSRGRVAAWDAARDAAWALAIRHLIGQHGFTQEHYDTLTGPWRKVIGPVHPEDAPTSSRTETK